MLWETSFPNLSHNSVHILDFALALKGKPGNGVKKNGVKTSHIVSPEKMLVE